MENAHSQNRNKQNQNWFYVLSNITKLWPANTYILQQKIHKTPLLNTMPKAIITTYLLKSLAFFTNKKMQIIVKTLIIMFLVTVNLNSCFPKKYQFISSPEATIHNPCKQQINFLDSSKTAPNVK